VIWIVYVCLGIGLAFNLLGTLALHRFPDVYTRLHGATKCTTFGSIFFYLGIILYAVLHYIGGNHGYAGLAIHTFLVLAFIFLTNPTGAHAIARAAHRSGVMPKRAVVDKLREVRK
jgi:multicomponent Na+:H+ antiporter subunit G